MSEGICQELFQVFFNLFLAVLIARQGFGAGLIAPLDIMNYIIIRTKNQEEISKFLSRKMTSREKYLDDGRLKRKIKEKPAKGQFFS